MHGVVRWMGRLDWVLNGFYKGQFSKAIPNLKNGLRVALYQILFLDKVPDHAAVNEAVEFVKKLQARNPVTLQMQFCEILLEVKTLSAFPIPMKIFLAIYALTTHTRLGWSKDISTDLEGRILKNSFLLIMKNLI